MINAYTIKIDLLKAVMLSSAVKDIRYYLNGVLFEVKNKKSFLVATDGHRMHVGNNGDLDLPDMQIIISTEDLKAAIKAWPKAIPCFELVKMEEHKKWKLGAHEFYEEDGTYPDYRRVIPDVTETVIPKFINASYVADFGKGCKILGDKTQSMIMHTHLYNDGRQCILLKSSAIENFFGIMMGQRDSKNPKEAEIKSKEITKPDWLI